MTGLRYTGAALKESAWRSRNRGTGHICACTAYQRTRKTDTRCGYTRVSRLH